MEQRFAHRAMATTFEVVVASPFQDANAIAQEAFAVIDRLEIFLSHYLSTSDIGQINSARVDQPVRVALETMECLVLCRRLLRTTMGLFDVGIGNLILWHRAAGNGPRNYSDPAFADALNQPGLAGIRLDTKSMEVTRLHPGVRLDLGGIGKGFALDIAAREMRTRDTPLPFLLHSGTSTVLALDAPPASPSGWKVGRGASTMALKNSALSASGTAIRGPHIIHPRTGRPAAARERVWCHARHGATSDAASTAVMLMTDHQLARFRAENPEIECTLQD